MPVKLVYAWDCSAAQGPASRDLFGLCEARWVSVTYVVILQAGLSALKTPQSYSSTSNKEDPLSTEVCTATAVRLPEAADGDKASEHNKPLYSDIPCWDCPCSMCSARLCQAGACPA